MIVQHQKPEALEIQQQSQTEEEKKVSEFHS